MVILDVINHSLVLVGKIEVNRYFPVLMHPNRFYEFNHNPAVKALNVFVFQKGGQIWVLKDGASAPIPSAITCISSFR